MSTPPVQHPPKRIDGRSTNRPPKRKKRPKPKSISKQFTKKRGRKKLSDKRFHGAKGRYVSYLFATQIVQHHKLRTRKDYWAWLYSEEVCYLPLNPNKVYPEWVSWGEFLQSDKYPKHPQLSNFEGKRTYPSFWEAVAQAQQLCKQNNLVYQADYKKYHKENNILTLPRYPETYYKDSWLGWETWLGKTVSSQLITQQYQEQYFLIVQTSVDTYSFYTTKSGKDDAKNYLSTPGRKLIKAYVWDSEVAKNVEKVLDMYCGEEEDDERVCGNINAVVYEIDVLLMVYRG